MSILFLGKKNDTNTNKALEFLNKNFNDVIVYLGEWGDEFPHELHFWSGEYIISYLSRWIVPESLLSKASKAAINFHPASPNYPGIGCNNFALYENSHRYGVTCHHMSKNVDEGDIILTKDFSIYKNDDNESLLERTYDYMLNLFYDVMDYLIFNRTLPKSKVQWSRNPFTRKQFNELEFIDLNMSEKEILKRIRAIKYREYNVKIKINDLIFKLDNT